MAMLRPGVYGLSNHLLDTPWNKVTSGKAALDRLLSGSELREDGLFAMLDDRSPAPEEALPATGADRDFERRLSARFIVDEVYGTRCSSVLLISEHEARFRERTFDETGATVSEAEFAFGRTGDISDVDSRRVPVDPAREASDT